MQFGGSLLLNSTRQIANPDQNGRTLSLVVWTEGLNILTLIFL